jgi:hypothetical protein
VTRHEPARVFYLCMMLVPLVAVAPMHADLYPVWQLPHADMWDELGFTHLPTGAIRSRTGETIAVVIGLYSRPQPEAVGPVWLLPLCATFLMVGARGPLLGSDQVGCDRCPLPRIGPDDLRCQSVRSQITIGIRPSG